MPIFQKNRKHDWCATSGVYLVEYSDRWLWGGETFCILNVNQLSGGLYDVADSVAKPDRSLK